MAVNEDDEKAVNLVTRGNNDADSDGSDKGDSDKKKERINIPFEINKKIEKLSNDLRYLAGYHKDIQLGLLSHLQHVHKIHTCMYYFYFASSSDYVPFAE